MAWKKCSLRMERLICAADGAIYKPEMIQVSKDFRSQSQGRLCLKSLEYLTETKESSEVDAVYTPCNSQGGREAVETRWYLLGPLACWIGRL